MNALRALCCIVLSAALASCVIPPRERDGRIVVCVFAKCEVPLTCSKGD